MLAPSRTAPDEKAAYTAGPPARRQPWHALTRTHAKLAVIVLTIAALAGGYSYLVYRPMPVTVAGISENVAVRVFGLGTVEARILSKVGFEVGATVVELNADHGDPVKAGANLGRLQATQQEAKFARAKASC